MLNKALASVCLGLFVLAPAGDATKAFKGVTSSASEETNRELYYGKEAKSKGAKSGKASKAKSVKGKYHEGYGQRSYYEPVTEKYYEPMGKKPQAPASYLRPNPKSNYYPAGDGDYEESEYPKTDAPSTDAPTTEAPTTELPVTSTEYVEPEPEKPYYTPEHTGKSKGKSKYKKEYQVYTPEPTPAPTPEPTPVPTPERTPKPTPKFIPYTPKQYRFPGTIYNPSHPYYTYGKPTYPRNHPPPTSSYDKYPAAPTPAYPSTSDADPYSSSHEYPIVYVPNPSIHGPYVPNPYVPTPYVPSPPVPAPPTPYVPSPPVPAPPTPYVPSPPVPAPPTPYVPSPPVPAPPTPYVPSPPVPAPPTPYVPSPPVPAPPVTIPYAPTPSQPTPSFGYGGIYDGNKFPDRGDGDCDCTAYLGTVWMKLSRFIGLEDICCIVGAQIYEDYVFYKYRYKRDRTLSESSEKEDHIVDNLGLSDDQIRKLAQEVHDSELSEGEVDEFGYVPDGSAGYFTASEPHKSGAYVPSNGHGAPIYSESCNFDPYFPKDYISCLVNKNFQQAVEACYCYYRSTVKCEYKDTCGTKTFKSDLYVAGGPFNACKQCPDGKEYPYDGKPKHDGLGYRHLNMEGEGEGEDASAEEEAESGYGAEDEEKADAGYGVGQPYKYEKGSSFDKCLGYCFIADSYHYKYKFVRKAKENY